MAEFNNDFYKTQKWVKLRDRVMKEHGGLCQMCLKKGIMKPAEIVHHTIPLTEENIHDESITLNAKLLIPLCRDCHGLVHRTDKGRRYVVNDDGTVTIPPWSSLK